MSNSTYTLGIDIGSTTVKVAVLDEKNQLLFSDYERHFANIQETLAGLLQKAENQLGDLSVYPAITGSGGLTLARHLEVPFIQEVVAVATALETAAPQTDVAIELGGEDAKIIYFEGGNVEQRMNGICAGGTGSFIDQMASLLQTDASNPSVPYYHMAFDTDGRKYNAIAFGIKWSHPWKVSVRKNESSWDALVTVPTEGLNLRNASAKLHFLHHSFQNKVNGVWNGGQVHDPGSMTKIILGK